MSGNATLSPAVVVADTSTVPPVNVRVSGCGVQSESAGGQRRPALPKSAASITSVGRRPLATTALETWNPTFQTVSAIADAPTLADRRCSCAASMRSIHAILVSRGTSLPSCCFQSARVIGPTPAYARTGRTARLKSDPGMASPAGLTLIAPKARATAVSLPPSANERALTLTSCAPAGAAASSSVEAAKPTVTAAERNVPERASDILMLPQAP